MSRRVALVASLLLAACEPSILIGRLTIEGDAGEDAGMDADDGDADADADVDAGSDASDGDADAGDGCEPFVATHLSASEGHACAIRAGRVYCWGAGGIGELGNGELGDRGLPTPIMALGTFTGLTTMTLGTCVERSDDTLFCFGENFSGGIADGGDDYRVSPVETVTGAVSYVGGQGFMITAGAGGVLTVWGSNQYGQLGLGPASVGMPIRTETVVAGTAFTGGVAAGWHHACAIDGDAHVHCAGDNTHNAIGIPGVPGGNADVFTLVTDQLAFASVDAGYNRTCGVTTTGELYCWGLNVPTIVAGGPTSLTVPTVVPDLDLVEQISVGFDTVCVRRDGGRVYCWGDGERYALAQPTEDDLPVPTEVTPGTRYTHVSVGQDYACAIRADDAAVVCWGANEVHQLGRGDDDTTSYAPDVVCAP